MNSPGFGTIHPAELDAVLAALRDFRVSVVNRALGGRNLKERSGSRASARSSEPPALRLFLSGAPGRAGCRSGPAAALRAGAGPRRRPGRGRPPRLGRNRSAPSFASCAHSLCPFQRLDYSPIPSKFCGRDFEEAEIRKAPEGVSNQAISLPSFASCARSLCPFHRGSRWLVGLFLRCRADLAPLTYRSQVAYSGGSRVGIQFSRFFEFSGSCWGKPGEV